MELLAHQPNVAVKISGLGVPGQRWTAELQRPVVRDAIAIFGAERAMFASNYPVDSLVATFDEIYGSFLEITRELPEAARRRLFHDNAVRIYRPVRKTPLSKPAVGMIGLGLMGEAMARRLIETGHAVAGYDIVAEKVAAAAALRRASLPIARRGRPHQRYRARVRHHHRRGRGVRARQ